ncbi:hypothetical protein [Glycomyces harbinensis]|uniref:Uncharacterized protein n=1 Tax=Glycomyces harbinensis TaxID=58114 RepID=A0A1G6Z4I7_9ACTN|nr:hypothetical protein [Glycomyces harbinensis]SDD97528.1 hypothetical protein SAMN05216270_11050 [Glycomyces harbinensis]
MRPKLTGPSAKPKTVLAAQGVIWLQFAAIVLVYSIGVRFLFDATRSESSHETMLDIVSGIGLENAVTILLSVAITVSMPFIAIRLGQRRAHAVRAAWWALAIVPFAMYLWILGRAYFATFPDEAPFFLSAAAMLVVCGSFPTATLLLLRARGARAWFAAEVLFEEIDRELSDTAELESVEAA